MTRTEILRMMVFIGALTFSQIEPAAGLQTAADHPVRGTVTRQGTTQGVADIQVSFVRAGARAGAITIKTDRDGRFSASGLTAGTYEVRAERKGYFGDDLGGRTPRTFATRVVNIATGSTGEIGLSLTPGSAVSGRVVDSEGRPVVDAVVHAFRIFYEEGEQATYGVTKTTTNDRGEFRLYWLPPGDYYLGTNPAQQTARGLSGGGRGAPPREGPVRTFYPDGVDIESAKVVSLRGGEEITGTTINMRTSALVTASGKVTSIVAAARIAVILLPRERSVDWGVRTTASAAPDGTFQIAGVAPGAYDLYGEVTNTGASTAAAILAGTIPGYYRGRTPIEVGFQDVQGISVAIGQGVELKAYATIDGSASAASGNVRVTLQAKDSARAYPDYAGGMPGREGVAEGDGSITIPFVYEGLYRVLVRSSRGAPYVEDIRENGVSVYDEGLRIGKEAPKGVQIILKTNGGSIEGTALDSQQLPKAGATVVLVPPEHRRQNPALYKTATSNAMGRFVVRGVPPGEYKLFAWESIPTGAHQNASFISRHETRGTVITVSASSTTNAQVRVIPADR